MEHNKTKKHVIKKAGGFLLLTAVILAGVPGREELPVIGSHSFMPGGERSTRNSVLKKQRITGKIKPVKISFWLAQALDW